MESSHFYLQRDLLTRHKRSELARVFTQDLTHFKLYRSPVIFNYILEFLRQGEHSIPKSVRPEHVSLFYDELKYWGISCSSSSVDGRITQD
jgi:hypothetical protein